MRDISIDHLAIAPRQPEPHEVMHAVEVLLLAGFTEEALSVLWRITPEHTRAEVRGKLTERGHG